MRFIHVLLLTAEIVFLFLAAESARATDVNFSAAELDFKLKDQAAVTAFLNAKDKVSHVQTVERLGDEKAGFDLHDKYCILDNLISISETAQIQKAEAWLRVQIPIGRHHHEGNPVPDRKLFLIITFVSTTGFAARFDQGEAGPPQTLIAECDLDGDFPKPRVKFP